jgi:hypothetical protein
MRDIDETYLGRLLGVATNTDHDRPGALGDVRHEVEEGDLDERRIFAH